MSKVLTVGGLRKNYPAFQLYADHISLEEGRIMGLVGRNGAGKTTFMKSILGLVHPDEGEISFFGMSFADHEAAVKQKIGYAAGTTSYYKRKKIREVAEVTKTFYDEWDEQVWRKYLSLFELDPEKTPMQLSEGMKVKLNLALSMSHHAKLLILDEPTSGLDPVSRGEILENLLELEERGVSILFSTHIISDLDHCADDITYVQKGRVLYSGSLVQFEKQYLLFRSPEKLEKERSMFLLGRKREKQGFSYLIAADQADAFPEFEMEKPDIEEIMFHLEKGAADEEADQ